MTEKIIVLSKFSCINELIYEDENYTSKTFENCLDNFLKNNCAEYTDNSLRSPMNVLHIICRSKYLLNSPNLFCEIFDIIIKKGVDVNAANFLGNTLLHHLAFQFYYYNYLRNKLLVICHYIIQNYNININIKNHNDISVIDMLNNYKNEDQDPFIFENLIEMLNTANDIDVFVKKEN